ncbi:MAG TPA: response regulator [Lysobacter sp.]
MLFVEDSFLLAQSAVLALGDAGLNVHPVPDAQSALGLFEQRRFDCAVIDVELPGDMDGVELARRLLQLRPDLPIVLATGYDAARCGAPAGVPVFQKPYRFEEITASVCPRVLALAQR